VTRATRTRMAALCVAVALLAGIASGIGVFMRGDGSTAEAVSIRGERFDYVTTGVYAYNPERLVAEGVGWDVFTLFVAVPTLLASVPLVAKGSFRGRLFAIGLLAYLFYQYLMYAMAWAFGPLLPLFVVIYAAALGGALWLASSIGLSGLERRFSNRYPRRGMAILSFLMALVLVGMWSQLIATGLGGDLSGANLLGQTTLVVQALDLGLVVPAALFTAFALWRRRPIGYLLGAVFVVKAVAMAAAICAMLVSAWVVEGAPEVSGFVIFGSAALASAWLGFRMYGSALPLNATPTSSGGAL
jgi:hypothetical protein